MTSRLSLYVFPALLAACALLTVTGSTGLPENVPFTSTLRMMPTLGLPAISTILMLLCLVGLPRFCWSG